MARKKATKKAVSGSVGTGKLLEATMDKVRLAKRALKAARKGYKAAKKSAKRARKLASQAAARPKKLARRAKAKVKVKRPGKVSAAIKPKVAAAKKTAASSARPRRRRVTSARSEPAAMETTRVKPVAPMSVTKVVPPAEVVMPTPPERTIAVELPQSPSPPKP